MSAPTNRPASEATYKQISEKTPFQPEELFGDIGNVPLPDRVELYGDFQFGNYKYQLDESGGFFLTNGKSAFHIDNSNNMIFSTGFPGLGGSGGKMVFNGGDKLEKVTTVAIEVSGQEISDTRTGDDGNIEKVEAPAYSLKVYGDIAIECVGGDVTIKGDNVTVNSQNTLNLKSGKDINIQAGVDGGNINFQAGTIKMDAAFLKKKISGGEYNDNIGEVETQQFKPGAQNTISSVGDIDRQITGNVNYKVLGNYELQSTGYGVLGFKQDFGFTAANYASVIQGKKREQILGLNPNVGGILPSTPTWNYSIEVGASKLPQPGFVVESLSGAAINTIGSAVGQGIELNVNKTISTLKLTPENISMGISKLTSLNMGLEESDFSYGGSKFYINAASAGVSAPAIFLN